MQNILVFFLSSSSICRLVAVGKLSSLSFSQKKKTKYIYFFALCSSDEFICSSWQILCSYFSWWLSDFITSGYAPLLVFKVYRSFCREQSIMMGRQKDMLISQSPIYYKWWVELVVHNMINTGKLLFLFMNPRRAFIKRLSIILFFEQYISTVLLLFLSFNYLSN